MALTQTQKSRNTCIGFFLRVISSIHPPLGSSHHWFTHLSGMSLALLVRWNQKTLPRLGGTLSQFSCLGYSQFPSLQSGRARSYSWLCVWINPPCLCVAWKDSCLVLAFLWGWYAVVLCLSAQAPLALFLIFCNCLYHFPNTGPNSRLSLSLWVITKVNINTTWCILLNFY